jgi:hypothetical protein
MKNLTARILAIFALVAFVFAGCSLAAPSSGHVSISVPSDAASLNVASRAATGDEYVRIYVVMNGSFVKLGTSTDYTEKLLSAGSSMSIELPAGSGYKAYAALGTKSGGLWEPTWYGGTGSFTVSAGVYTDQTIKVVARHGIWYASSGSAGTIAIDGTLWRLTGTTVSGNGSDVSLAGKGSIYSLTEGLWFDGKGGFAKEPWINTSSGIYTIKGALLKRADINASYSGALANGKNLVVFYYGSDVGFASSDNAAKTSVDADWSHGGLKEFLGTDDGKSFKDLVSDVSSLIKDSTLIIDGDKTYGLVATSLGTYLYNEQAKSDMGTDKDHILAWVKDQIKSSTYAFALYDSAGKSAPITALAFDSDTAPTNVYAGSGIGLFYASAADLSSAKAAPALARVAGITANVAKVAASGAYVAYADSEGTVTLLKNNSPVASYPFYAYTATGNGLSDLSFYGGADGLHLAFSSGNGIMDIVVP